MQHEWQAGTPAETEVAQVYDEFVHLVRFLTAGERAHDSALSLAQHSLLGFIARHPGCRATEISETFGVNRSTVSRQVRNAVEAGWVEAMAGPVRTGNPLRLTDRGRAILDDTVLRRHGEIRVGLAGWEKDDLDRFVHLLHRFRSGVEWGTTRTPDQNDGDISA